MPIGEDGYAYLDGYEDSAGKQVARKKERVCLCVGRVVGIFLRGVSLLESRAAMDSIFDD